MDTLPLPPHPSLDQYRKRAKELVTAARSHDKRAIRAWATEWLEALAGLLNIELTPFVRHSLDRAVEHIERRIREKQKTTDDAGASFALAEAQYLIAEAHGFASWPAFASHVELVARPRGTGDEFEQAADAIVSGDLSALRSLLDRKPELVRARSKRVHQATLLHYVAANGVEDFRQKTPANAVAVAKLLLDAGAEVDAIANTYGGGKAQTTMNLLVSSAHPAAAGLQGALVETLLDYGAAINGLEDDASPLITALAFNYAECAKVLARRGARADTVILAAAIGRTDVVRDFISGARPMTSLPVTAGWLQLPTDRKGQLEMALVWACKFGRTETAQLLLESGVSVGAKDRDSMTALHWAAASGSIDLVRALLSRGAPLEVENVWGGTVLDSTGYFIGQEPKDSLNYLPVVEALLAAGADARRVSPFPTGNTAVDKLLRRYLKS